MFSQDTMPYEIWSFWCYCICLIITRTHARAQVPRDMHTHTDKHTHTHIHTQRHTHRNTHTYIHHIKLALQIFIITRYYQMSWRSMYIKEPATIFNIVLFQATLPLLESSFYQGHSIQVIISRSSYLGQLIYSKPLLLHSEERPIY